MTRMRTGLTLLLLVACLAAPTAAQEKINWAPSLQAAINMASRQNQLVLLHFWAPGCLPCKALDKNVFSRQDVANYIDQHYVPVKINAAAMPDTARRYKVDRWPMDVIITPAGYALHSTVSPQDPREYMTMLNKIAMQRDPSGGSNVAGLGTPQGVQGAGDRFANQVREGAGQARDQFNQAANQAQDRFQQAGDRFQDAGDRFREAANETRNQLDATAAETRNRFDAVDNQVREGANQWQDAARGTADRFTQFNNRQGPPAQPVSQGGDPQQNPYVGPQGNQPVQPNPYVNNQPRQPLQPQPRHDANRPAAPVGNPGLGLDGFCPVTLAEQTKWQKGDPRWGIIHRGRTYLFVTEAAKKQFWGDPDRYAPILSGNDPVEYAESGRLVAGSRTHGVFFRKQIYLFSSEDTLRRFWDAPGRYADAARQAMQRANERARR